MKDRVIRHADLNNFYASVECRERPELWEKPMAVCGDPELRHGVILAKNMPAKRLGIKTGETLWQARQKCPELLTLPPRFKLYEQVAHQVRAIYGDYTDQIEPFGLDEAWLDVTGSTHLFGGGGQIADELRKRIKAEIGITASIGVSWNKIFAKLGSDIKKPDGTTEITRENYRTLVWPLPAGDLLYVGPATKRKLAARGVHTIGAIARLDADMLRFWFGKWGDVLHAFASGLDCSPVAVVGCESPVKSVGNSTTTPRDLTSNEDVSMVLYVLAESVAMRLREQGLECRTVELQVRDTELFSFVRQRKHSRATCLASEIHDAAMALFTQNYTWSKPIRSIGVRACDLQPAGRSLQLSFLCDELKRDRLMTLERTVDRIRDRYGNLSVQRAILLADKRLCGINPKDDHLTPPMGRL